MWSNTPAWMKVIRDVTAAAIGLGGAALLILRGNPDPIVLIVLFTLAGAPGAVNLSNLLTGGIQRNSPTGTDGQSPSQSQSDSSS